MSTKKAEVKTKKESEAPVTTPATTSETAVQEMPKEHLHCIACGSEKFVAKNGVLAYCGDCGTNADWAYTEEFAELAMKYVKEKTNSRAPKEDEMMPQCQAKIPHNGTIATCNSRSWIATADGKGLAYCAACGTNWTGPQPDNVQELLKKIGSKKVKPPISNIRQVTDEGQRRVSNTRTRGKKVTLEDYTVRE